MRVVTTVAELRRARSELTGPVGVVPTMGALHAGHQSLITRARQECAGLVVTLFVNPAQFGPKEDFGRYPRVFERDREICQSGGVDLLYAPETVEVYPPDFSTYVEVSALSEPWEGAARPGHFRGVATVVAKLLISVWADRAYFGEKDYQQLQVVTRLARDLDLPTTVVGCPTIREPDGLALSSRNVYLTGDERPRAAAIHRGLSAARRAAADGECHADRLLELVEREIRAGDLTLDYAAIVDTNTLEPIERVRGTARALVAARLGAVRLIDNIALELPASA